MRLAMKPGFWESVKSLWLYIRYSLGEGPNIPGNTDCAQCGHPWMIHSFYGITRSECQDESCDCRNYYQSGQYDG